MNSVPFLSETRANCEASACGLTLNISRQRMTNDTWERLLQYAVSHKVIEAQIQMMEGAVVNTSEKRQVLHTSLRSRDARALITKKYSKSSIA